MHDAQDDETPKGEPFRSLTVRMEESTYQIVFRSAKRAGISVNQWMNRAAALQLLSPLHDIHTARKGDV